jgi:hypothetical protein
MAPSFLTSALDGGSSVSRLSRFTPGERGPSTRSTGDWAGPRAGLDAVEKRKSLAPAGNLTWTVQPVARRYTGSHGLSVSTAKLLARRGATTGIVCRVPRSGTANVKTTSCSPDLETCWRLRPPYT